MPSLLRGFSAPVKMAVEGQTDADLVFLLAHDTGESWVLPRHAKYHAMPCRLGY